MNRNNYTAIANTASETIPWAVEMELLFGKGNVDHCYTQSSKEFPVLTWFSEAFIEGHYKIDMRLEVRYDENTGKLIPIEKPKFSITEITQVDDLMDGRYMAYFDGSNVTFDVDAWKKYYESRGDLRVLGLTENAQPTPLFDNYKNTIRRDRTPISLIK